MPQPSLRSLTSPSTLAVFEPRLLHDLLSPHRDYLAAHDYGLPAGREDDLDLRAISAALLADDADFPADLVDGIATIVEVGQDLHLAAMEAVARRSKIALTEPGAGETAVGSPVDVATRIWLANPALLRRIHAEAAIPAARRWEVWRCTESEIPALALPDEPEELMALWAQDLDQHLLARHFGTGTRIYACPTGRLVYFLIRHGATLQRVPTHHEDGSTDSVVFRPSMTDVLRYDPTAGELGIHLQRHTKWLSEAMRASMSLRLFGRPHLFTGERRVSLDPLHLDGETVLDCAGFPTIASVALTELEFTYGDADAGKTIYRAVDVFRFLRARGIVLADQPTPTAAKLKVRMVDGPERTVTLRFPNVAVYQRLGDDDAIGAFLAEQGFTAMRDDDALDQVA